MREPAAKDALDCVLYDGACPMCVGSMRRFEGVLRRRGFELATLQSREDCPVAPVEMRVVTSDGRAYGGAAALVHVARRVWWAWPLFALAQIPGVMPLLDGGYRWLAANRAKFSAAGRGQKNGAEPRGFIREKKRGAPAPKAASAAKRRRHITTTFFEMP